MKIDVTHTVKPDPQGRRLMKNDDGTTFWEEPEVPEGYFDGPPSPPLGHNVEADVLAAPVVEPVIEPEPVVEEEHTLHKSHHKGKK